MAHELLAGQLLDEYTSKMLSNTLFRDIEVKRFRKLEANLKNMTFEQRVKEADVVVKGVCSVSYEFTEAFCKTQLESYIRGKSGKINATAICNIAYIISLLNEGKLKMFATKIYDDMCQKYIK